MKKLITVFAAIVLNSFPVSANIYIDGFGLWGDHGDAGTMPGFGLGVMTDIAPQVNAGGRFSMSKFADVTAGVKTAEYENLVWYGLLEYNYKLREIPLILSGVFGAGVSKLRMSKKIDEPFGGSYSVDMKDTGFYTVFSGGIRYMFTQRMAIFAQAGYHRGLWYSGQLSDAKIGGYTIAAGVTATVFGRNTRIDDDY